ncbi:hypothetical protein SAY86_029868 [Trapa natans]|uniref:BZIP domain-containing protein n=1 Tax=Trapa natans TaxID=22666 RepID=A0AAN7MF55_TRANT|nr:hypothetical protein SAY86_029868 [Trapa natans]
MVLRLLAGVGSSGSETSVDEKKRRRMNSNRESARRSRMKKQKHLQDLIAEMGRLERERREMLSICDDKTKGHLILEAENGALLAEKAALAGYLGHLEALMIRKFKEAGGQCSGVQEPWQVHYPPLHVAASNTGVFRI